MSAGLPYLRRRARRLTSLLLPALLLRALIPFGFMPLLSGGAVTIGLCPGDALPGITAAHTGHAGEHAQHSGGTLGAPVGTHHAPCLYAASAAPGFAPAMLAVAVSAPDVAVQRLPTSDAVFLPTILRAQSSRGPPLSA